jgi:hypothetical protein
MKRSSLYLYLGVWLSSIVLSFFVGQALSSHNTNSSEMLSLEQQIANIQKNANRDNISTESQGNTDDATALEDAELGLLPSRKAVIAKLDEAFALPMSDPQRFNKINELLKLYAAIDPLAALDLADSLPSLRDAERARNNILEVWASNEPMAALAWAEVALADVPSNLRSSQLQAIIRGFAETNPKGAFDYANGLSEDSNSEIRLKNRLLSEVIETQIRAGGLAEAQATIALMPDGQTKENLQRELVDEWAEFDPVSAAAYVQSLGSDASTNIKTTLIQKWAQNDPAAAAAWMSNLATDDPAYSRATAEITREWTRYDLTASSEWLNSLTASPELDRAVATYTFRAAEEDPSAAMTWAESISDDRLRSRMMEQVAANWKSDDTEGFTAYLDESDLTTEQREQLETAQTRGTGGGRGRGRPDR